MLLPTMKDLLQPFKSSNMLPKASRNTTRTMASQDFEELARIFAILQLKHPNPNAKDYLSTLPAELLIQILADVPLLSYLDICRTSKTLNAFMHQNARELCNARILSNYWEASISLKSIYIGESGWIVPTISFIHWWEIRAIESARTEQSDENLNYTIKITKPGPQFAAMLEEGRVAFEGPRGGLQAREDRLKELLDRWNCIWGVGANGKVERFVKDRRLAWFYGFPVLESVEKVAVHEQEENVGEVVGEVVGDREESAGLFDDVQMFDQRQVRL